jgi:hypothetical protein
MLTLKAKAMLFALLPLRMAVRAALIHFSKQLVS